MALKTLAQFGHPIWITEFNHPSGSQSAEEQQSEGLRKTMIRLRELQPVYNGCGRPMRGRGTESSRKARDMADGRFSSRTQRERIRHALSRAKRIA